MVLLAMALCGLVGRYHFRRTYCLHLQLTRRYISEDQHRHFKGWPSLLAMSKIQLFAERYFGTDSNEIHVITKKIFGYYWSRPTFFQCSLLHRLVRANFRSPESYSCRVYAAPVKY